MIRRSSWSSPTTPEEIIEKIGITALPIDPRIIAKWRDIEIQGQPLDGPSGCLVCNAGEYGIVYSTSLNNPGFINFTIAHELGHYFTPHHPELLFPDGSGIHRSRAGFVSEQKHEREADDYAVHLLMPKDLFEPALRRAGQGLGAIKTLANQCGTSLTASAIRCATLSTEPLVVVVTSQNRIDYCIVSKPLRADCDGWSLRGRPVPREAIAWDYVQFPEKIRNRAEEVGECDLRCWFPSGPPQIMVEEAQGLGRYGKVISVLTLE